MWLGGPRGYCLCRFLPWVDFHFLDSQSGQWSVTGLYGGPREAKQTEVSRRLEWESLFPLSLLLSLLSANTWSLYAEVVCVVETVLFVCHNSWGFVICWISFSPRCFSRYVSWFKIKNYQIKVLLIYWIKWAFNNRTYRNRQIKQALSQIYSHISS